MLSVMPLCTSDESFISTSGDTKNLDSFPDTAESLFTPLNSDLKHSFLGLVEIKAKLQTSEESCRNLQTANSALQRQLDEAKESLNDAQAFILSLQRRDPVLKEMQATEYFSAYCIKVEEWVIANWGYQSMAG
jgi:gas vesicle protein